MLLCLTETNKFIVVLFKFIMARTSDCEV